MKRKSTTDPVAVQFGNQLLAFTLGDDNNLQTSLWLTGTNQWIPLQLTGAGGAVPTAPQPASNANPLVNMGQLNCCYRDVNNHIINLVHVGIAWIAMPVTGPGGAATAPAAAGTPSPIQFGGFFHCFFRDTKGYIWDAFLVGTTWQLMQITGPGSTAPSAAPAAGDLTIAQSDTQIHIFYRGTDNHLWDAFAPAGLPWNAAKISDDMLAGNPAVIPDNPFYFPSNDKYHALFVVYRTTDGTIKGVMFEGDKKNNTPANGKWLTYTFNGPNGSPKAPLAATDPWMGKVFGSGTVFGSQIAIYYLDKDGNLVAVSVNSYLYNPGLSDGKQFANMLTGLIKITAYKAPDSKPSVDYNYVLALGPSGFLKTPALKGKPQVVIAGDSSIHTFYRDINNDVYDLYVNVDLGSGASNAALSII